TEVEGRVTEKPRVWASSRKKASPASRSPNPAVCSGDRKASARARGWGPSGSRVLRMPATPGWSSSTWRSRWARTLSFSVHQGGVQVEVDLGQDAVEEQVLELLFV